MTPAEREALARECCEERSRHYEVFMGGGPECPRCAAILRALERVEADRAALVEAGDGLADAAVRGTWDALQGEAIVMAACRAWKVIAHGGDR